MNLKRRLFLKLFAITGFAFFANPLYGLQIKRQEPKNVGELYLAMSSALPLGARTSIAWSVTEEEYVEYAIGVKVDEAIRRGLDPEALLCGLAWRTFLVQLTRLDDWSRAKLYWRMPPEIAFFDHDDSFDRDDSFKEALQAALNGDAKMSRVEKRARLYCRYLISSKPEKSTQAELLAKSETMPRRPEQPFHVPYLTAGDF